MCVGAAVPQVPLLTQDEGRGRQRAARVMCVFSTVAQSEMVPAMSSLKRSPVHKQILSSVAQLPPVLQESGPSVLIMHQNRGNRVGELLSPRMAGRVLEMAGDT